MAIEKSYPSNPDEVIYAAANFMQIWVELHRENDEVEVKETAQCLIIDWMGKKEQFSGVCTGIMVM